MNIDLRQLRSFVAIIDEGSFTDAAIELRMSQAAVSRNLAALESALGARLVRRTTRTVELTPAGERAIPHARRAIANVAELQRAAQHGHGVLTFGYAWSALGKHTVEFQRRWAAAHPDSELELVRLNSPTAGLAEGSAQLSILRRPLTTRDYEVALVGMERRYCAMASDHPLASRRSITLADVATSPLAIDSRTGSTVLDLWPEGARPARVIDTNDVDDWLALISSARAFGMTSEATAHQYRRPGVSYRLVRDAPRIAVYLAWSRIDPPAQLTDVLELVSELYRKP